MSEKTIQKNKLSHVSSEVVMRMDDLQLPTLARDGSAPTGFSIVIRSLLQNWRQGTVACQTLAEVTGSNKKPFKQKGTGRARAGSVKSPLWRGGGVIFGPQPRTRTLKVSKKLRRAVARGLVQGIIEQERLLVIDWALQGDKPSTRQAYDVLKKAGLEGIQTNVFANHTDAMTIISFGNIPSVRVVYFDSPNAYVLSDARYWVVFKNDIDAFKNMVSQWT